MNVSERQELVLFNDDIQSDIIDWRVSVDDTRQNERTDDSESEQSLLNTLIREVIAQCESDVFVFLESGHKGPSFSFIMDNILFFERCAREFRGMIACDSIRIYASDSCISYFFDNKSQVSKKNINSYINFLEMLKTVDVHFSSKHLMLKFKRET